MSEHYVFIAEWITAVANLVLALGIGIAIYQAILLNSQLKDARKWNVLTAALEYMPVSSELSELEIELNKSIVRLIDREQPLTANELEELLKPESESIRIKLKNYLNLIERYCTAINFGIVDKEFAKSVFKEKFIRHYEELLPYIEHFRKKHNAQTYYCEMRRVVEEWKGVYQEPPKY
jgi:hypothetical protein